MFFLWIHCVQSMEKLFAKKMRIKKGRKEIRRNEEKNKYWVNFLALFIGKKGCIIIIFFLLSV